MSAIKTVQTSPNSWDIYAIERDEFLLVLELTDFDSEKNSCVLEWQTSANAGNSQEYVEAFRFIAREVLYGRNIWTVKTSTRLNDPGAAHCFELAGFIPGREFGSGEKRSKRYSCDRYDLVRTIAEFEMGKHLDMNIWSFGWDSAKRRFGVCKYTEKVISLSRYFVELHPLEEVHQTILHEVAHAIAGSKAGHGKKWKDIASSLGYRHQKLSGEKIGDATAKLIGTCPNGHVVYRHRQPKTPLSCSKCSNVFDRRFLITWTSR